MIVVSKVLWVKLGGLALGLVLAAMRAAQGQTPAVVQEAIPYLTQLSQLSQLSRPGHESGQPVRLHGTVLFANPAREVMGLRDETATAILHYESGGEPLRPGEKIELEGVARIEAGRASVRRAWTIDNDGLHPRAEKQLTAPLQAGPHSLRVDWFNQTQDGALEVYWEGPDLPRQLIPDSALWHEEPGPVGGASKRVAGLGYACFEGDWVRVPNFQGMGAVQTGVAANLDISLATRSNHVGLCFQGWVTVPRDGEYTVTLVSDDGARMSLGHLGPGNGPGAVLKRTGLVEPLPSPRALFPGAILASNDLVQWSSVEGLVTFMDQTKTPPQLELSDGGAKIQVEFVAASRDALGLLPQSRIRVTGLTRPRMTPQGLFVAAKWLVPDPQSVELLEAAPRHWNQAPPQTLGQVRAHPPRLESVGHLKGQARPTGAAGGFWLQDGTEEVYVRTAQPLPQTNEMLVEALGLWRHGSTTNQWVLDQAVYRRWIEPTNEAASSPTNALPLLTKIEEIHALSRAEAEKKYPVRVRGVILNQGGGTGMIQDDTRGIYFSGVEVTQPIAVGDLAEIEGVSGPGDFAPILIVQRLTRLGSGILPEPARPTWDLLLNGAMDAQRVELKGIITQAHSNHITLLMVGGELRISTDNTDSSDLAAEAWKPFLNALICLRGSLWARWNQQTHQVIAGEIALTDVQIDCLEPAPTDLFAAPSHRVADLSLFSLESSALRRVKVMGQVPNPRLPASGKKNPG